MHRPVHPLDEVHDGECLADVRLALQEPLGRLHRSEDAGLLDRVVLLPLDHEIEEVGPAEALVQGVIFPPERQAAEEIALLAVVDHHLRGPRHPEHEQEPGPHVDSPPARAAHPRGDGLGDPVPHPPLTLAAALALLRRGEQRSERRDERHLQD